MTQFIDQHKHEFGVEPICRTLQLAPSSYYAAKSRPPSKADARIAEVGGLDGEAARLTEDSPVEPFTGRCDGSTGHCRGPVSGPANKDRGSQALEEDRTQLHVEHVLPLRRR